MQDFIDPKVAIIKTAKKNSPKTQHPILDFTSLEESDHSIILLMNQIKAAIMSPVINKTKRTFIENGFNY